MKLIVTVLTVLFSHSLLAADPPFADIHIHYNWDQKEIISADEVVRRLKKNQVALTLVSSTPPELAVELAEAGGDWIKPFFTPYLTPIHKNFWTKDDQVLVKAEQGLSSGKYQGIGELHVWSGFGPRPNNKILLGLLKLAAQYQVPFLIHTEASSPIFFERICAAHPQVRFLWAHAGSRLEPDDIAILMKQCPNVWAEVSVRDPWRFNNLVDENWQLLPGWKALFIEFQDRFMTGTDPVWNVLSMSRWEQADEGWDHYDQLIDFHRAWLKQLPPNVEQKIRLENAKHFFAL